MTNPTVPTWAALRATLPLDDGRHAAALEVIRRGTAPARHASRVAATMAAIEAAYSHLVGVEEVWAQAQRWGMVALDLSGVGGGLGAVRGGTSRLPWARGLGTGRWQARDGNAWLAAAWAAASSLPDGRLWALGPAPGGGRLAVYEVGALVAELPDLESGSEPWVRQLCERAILLCACQVVEQGGPPLLAAEEQISAWADLLADHQPAE